VILRHFGAERLFSLASTVIHLYIKQEIFYQI
jgi:hypothetical protein